MAKVHKAPFAQTPQVFLAVATAAVPLTGAGSVADGNPTGAVLIGTAGAEGAILVSLSAIPRASVAATALWIWSSTDGGVTKMLIASALMPVYVLAATTQNKPTAFAHPDGTVISESAPLRLAANERLYGGMGVALPSGVVFTGRPQDF